jgi:hypothetical protein
LLVARFDAVLVVAARAVVLFDFGFLVGFAFLGGCFVLDTFLVEAFFLGAIAVRLTLRDFLVRFLAPPIAAPESAPITVPTTGTPRAVPATAPATAPPSVLPILLFSGLAASSSFVLSSMFSLLSWHERRSPFAGPPVNDEQLSINWFSCFRRREAKWK